MELEKVQPRDSSSDKFVPTSKLTPDPDEGLSDEEKARIVRLVPQPNREFQF